MTLVHAADSRDGADRTYGGAGGDAPGAGGARSTLAQLVHAGHQQAQAGRPWALWQGSVPVHLPNHQPGQLRVSRKSSLSFRTALPLLASGVFRQRIYQSIRSVVNVEFKSVGP